jgi:hypothetical protein
MRLALPCLIASTTEEDERLEMADGEVRRGGEEQECSSKELLSALLSSGSTRFPVPG